MPGVEVQNQLTMSLDDIISEATRGPPIEKRSSQDRRPRGQLFNVPRGVIKPRASVRSEDRYGAFVLPLGAHIIWKRSATAAAVSTDLCQDLVLCACTR